MKKFICIAVCFVLLLGSCSKKKSGNDRAASLKIKVGHANNQGDPSYDAWEKFKAMLENDSNGKITVDLFPGAAIGNERELVEQVKMNALDMTSVNIAPLCQSYSKFNIFVLPYIWKNEQHMFDFCDGEEGQDLARGFKEKTGISLLAYWDNGVRHTFQNEKAVLSPEDFKGLTIRVMNNDVYIKFFGAMDAQPSPMAFGEVYSALMTKVVDAADNDTSGYLSMKFYEPAKYFSLTGHVISCKPVLASSSFMSKIDKLPQDLQKVFFNVLEVTKNEQRANYVAKAQKDIEHMKSELGVQVNEVTDRNAFRKVAQQAVWPLFFDSIGQELIIATEKY